MTIPLQTEYKKGSVAEAFWKLKHIRNTIVDIDIEETISLLTHHNWDLKNAEKFLTNEGIGAAKQLPMVKDPRITAVNYTHLNKWIIMCPTVDVDRAAEIFEESDWKKQMAYDKLLDEMLEQHKKVDQTNVKYHKQKEDVSFKKYKSKRSDRLEYLYSMNQSDAGIVEASRQQSDDVKPTGRVKSLFIGINYVGTKNELEGCAEDANRMKKVCTEFFDFPKTKKSWTVMTDDNDDEDLLPTKDNILLGLDWLAYDAQPGDFLFLLYSGRGALLEDIESSEFYNEAIIPVDSSQNGCITDEMINNILVTPLKSGVKLFVIFDCCHNATHLDLPYGYKYDEGQWDTKDNPKFVEADVQLISGVTDPAAPSDVLSPYFGVSGILTMSIMHLWICQWKEMTLHKMLESLKVIFDAHFTTVGPVISSSQLTDTFSDISFQKVMPNNIPYVNRQNPRNKQTKEEKAAEMGMLRDDVVAKMNVQKEATRLRTSEALAATYKLDTVSVYKAIVDGVPVEKTGGTTKPDPEDPDTTKDSTLGESLGKKESTVGESLGKDDSKPVKEEDAKTVETHGKKSSRKEKKRRGFLCFC